MHSSKPTTTTGGRCQKWFNRLLAGMADAKRVIPIHACFVFIHPGIYSFCRITPGSLYILTLSSAFLYLIFSYTLCLAPIFSQALAKGSHFHYAEIIISFIKGE